MNAVISSSVTLALRYKKVRVRQHARWHKICLPLGNRQQNVEEVLCILPLAALSKAVRHDSPGNWGDQPDSGSAV